MKIAAFNIRRFGLKKVSDPLVLSTLVRVMDCGTFSTFSDAKALVCVGLRWLACLPPPEKLW